MATANGGTEFISPPGRRVARMPRPQATIGDAINLAINKFRGLADEDEDDEDSLDAFARPLACIAIHGEDDLSRRRE